AAGSRLYKVLLEPLMSNIESQRRLFIESDEFLSLVPWSATVMDTGRYLGEEYNLTVTPGLFFHSSSTQTTSTVRKILVADAGSVTIGGAHFPSPVQGDKEAHDILEFYPGGIFLHDYQVNRERLLSILPTVTNFHFIGHAITRQYGGELLLQADR